MTNDSRPGAGQDESASLPMETKLWRLAEIITAARRIHSSLTLETVLASFLDIATGEVGATGGSIYLRDGDREGLVLEHSLSEGVTSDDPERCAQLAREAASRGEMSVVARDEVVGAIVSLPLRDESGESLGVLQIYRDESSSLDDSDRLFLRELSHFASLSIRNAQYHRDSLVKARLDREVAVAREIQLGTLPREMPVLAGYDVAGFSRPAEETSGDSFDLIPSGTNDVVLLLADATGHSIGPALSVTQVRSMLRLAERLETDLDDILRHINDQLCADLQPNRFVTAFIGRLDTEAHLVRYHSAGQAPLMLYRAAEDEFEWLGSSTLPLGIRPAGEVKPPQVIQFAPGDILGLITDGVFEAENAEEQMLEMEGVAKIVRESRDKPCADLIEEIIDRVDEHRGAIPQADDVTIVLVRRTS